MSFDVKFEFDEDALEDAMYELPIEVDCPNCNGKISIKLKQVRAEEVVKCDHCDSLIQLEEKNA